MRRVFLYAILLGLMFWVSDAVLDRYVFFPNSRSLMEHAITNTNTHEVWVRVSFLSACLAAAYSLHLTYKRQLRTSQDNEEKFRSLYEEAPLAYQSLDEEGNLLEANQAWLDLLGYSSKSEVIGKSWREFLNEESQLLFDERFPVFKMVGDTRGKEFNLIDKQGREVLVSVDGRVSHDDWGNFKQTHCILHNVTALKTAYRKLAQVNERLSLAFEAANDGLWDWDLVNDQLYFSPRWYTMLGYKYREFPATYSAWAELLHPEIRENTEDRMAEVVRNNEDSFEIEFLMKTKAGDYKRILSRGTVIEKDGGKTKRMIGTHVDVDALRTIEEKMFMLKQFAEGAVQGFETATMEGKICYANPFLQELLKCEVVGKNMADFYDDKDFEELRALLPTEVGERVVLDMLLIDSEGKSIPTHQDVFVIEERGELRLANIITDTTAQNEYVAELKRQEQERERLISDLETSNEELKRFAYVASHDLQEPLRMVTSFLQLLTKKYQGELDDEAHEFIDFAVDGAQRMQELIASLLDYSRIGTQGEEFQFVSSDLIFNKAVADLSQAVEETNGSITCECSSNICFLPTIFGDPTQLAQLFQNVLGNAIKYHKKEEPPVVKLSWEEDDYNVTFKVADNGVGIEEEYLEKIFGVFQRLYSRDEYSGTGIGLAICRRVVQRHGGKMWVESEAGVGSTFYFSLAKPK